MPRITKAGVSYEPSGQELRAVEHPADGSMSPPVGSEDGGEVGAAVMVIPAGDGEPPDPTPGPGPGQGSTPPPSSPASSAPAEPAPKPAPARAPKKAVDDPPAAEITGSGGVVLEKPGAGNAD